MGLPILSRTASSVCVAASTVGGLVCGVVGVVFRGRQLKLPVPLGGGGGGFGHGVMGAGIDSVSGARLGGRWGAPTPVAAVSTRSGGRGCGGAGALAMARGRVRSAMAKSLRSSTASSIVACSWIIAAEYSPIPKRARSSGTVSFGSWPSWGRSGQRSGVSGRKRMCSRRSS